MPAESARELASRIFRRQQLEVIPLIPALAYVVTIAVGVAPDEALGTVLRLLPPLVLPVAVLMPKLAIDRIVRRALAENPGEPPGERLRRILEVPRRVEFAVLSSHFAGAISYGVLCHFFRGTAWAAVPFGGIVVLLLAQPFSVRFLVAIEDLLRPAALDEVARHPGAAADGRGALWVRQSWYLPFVVGGSMAATAGVFMVVCFWLARHTIQGLAAKLAAKGDLAASELVLAQARENRLGIGMPILLLSILLVVVAMSGARALARRLRESTQALERALVATAAGEPTLPAWTSSDELGDVAKGFSAVVRRLGEWTRGLRGSADRLSAAALELAQTNVRQGEVLTRQAAAVRQTDVTAREIGSASEAARTSAGSVLTVVEQAEAVGREGEQALGQSLGGLEEIRARVSGMAEQIRTVGERARRIAEVTLTVKGLADQTNMLALNAAIEAVRSGEQGKGFAVVAREMRHLADQSLRATRQISEMLDDVSHAIETAVATSSEGAQRVEANVDAVRRSSESLRTLSGLVHTTAQSVRQITATVHQQDAGTKELAVVMRELSEMTGATLDGLKSAQDATERVREVGAEVARLAGGQAA